MPVIHCCVQSPLTPQGKGEGRGGGPLTLVRSKAPGVAGVQMHASLHCGACQPLALSCPERTEGRAPCERRGGGQKFLYYLLLLVLEIAPEAFHLTKPQASFHIVTYATSFTLPYLHLLQSALLGSSASGCTVRPLPSCAGSNALVIAACNCSNVS